MQNSLPAITAERFKKSLRFVLFSTMGAALFALAVSLLIPNTYASSSYVYLFYPITGTGFNPTSQSINIGAGQFVNPPSSAFAGFLTTQPFDPPISVVSEVAGSLEMKFAAIDVVRSPLVTRKTVRDGDFKAEVVEYNTSLSQRTFVQLVKLTAQSKNAAVSRDLANAWAEAVCARLNGFLSGYGKEVGARIESEMDVAQSMLVNAEAALSEFDMDSLAALEKKVASERSALALRAAEKGSPEVEARAEELVKAKSVLREMVRRKAMLDREREEKSLLYEVARQKHALLRMSIAEREVTAKIAVRAVEPARHIMPKRSLIVAIASTLALVVSIVIVFLV